MNETMARLLTPAVNYAVVQLPGRKFPGVVFQGDSLHELVRLAKNLLNSSEEHKDGAVREACLEIHELLEAVLIRYESVLKEHGIKLPYHV
jgi:hypothetical protein